MNQNIAHKPVQLVEVGAPAKFPGVRSRQDLNGEFLISTPDIRATVAPQCQCR
jgi:hypothetical protein